MATETIGTPTECNIEKRRGDTKDLQIRLSNSAGSIDVAGYTATMTISTVKEPTDSSTVIFQTAGSPYQSPNDGILRFDFNQFPFQSPEIAPGSYFYDVQVTDAQSPGEIFTPLIGKFTVKQDITK
jgi:hypothetical protein